jgi:hypothetical protein
MQACLIRSIAGGPTGCSRRRCHTYLISYISNAKPLGSANPHLLNPIGDHELAVHDARRQDCGVHARCKMWHDTRSGLCMHALCAMGWDGRGDHDREPANQNSSDRVQVAECTVCLGRFARTGESKISERAENWGFACY